jgi:ABC-2 type transport system ATP-binding protein
MLELIDLKKSYGPVQALKGLNLQLNRGEIYGILGPNGAGKTTTIKIMASLLKADAGLIRLDGKPFDPSLLENKKHVAYVPDQGFLYGKLTGEEHLHFYADLFQIPLALRQAEIDSLFDLFEFEAYRHQLVESYSAGTKRKLMLAQGFLVHPQILLLDEPLTSLDPLVSRKVSLHIAEFARQGGLVILATHILDIARTICQTIGVIVAGRKVREFRRDQSGTFPDSTEKLEELYFETVLGQ